MAALDGPPQSWQEIRNLYEAHSGFVRRLLSRLGTPASDLDDLLQEVFLIALRKLAGFEGRSQPRTWLCGIAVRVAATARRRARLQSFIGLDRAPEIAGEGNPGDALEQKELSVQVRKVLSKLGEKKRAALVLFEVEGLSGEEIAEALGCPVATVWTRIHHARKDFLRLFKLQNNGNQPPVRLAVGGGA